MTYFSTNNINNISISVKRSNFTLVFFKAARLANPGAEINFEVSSSNILSFITNNVKGIQSYKKRLKLQYFKEKIGSTGVLFLQETHSSSKVEQKWKVDFKDHVFFSHGKTTFCGVLTSYFGKETFNVNKQKTDKEGRILILDISVNDSEYTQTNLYNANTEKEQINVFSNMSAILKKFDINPKKHNYGGRF